MLPSPSCTCDCMLHACMHGSLHARRFACTCPHTERGPSLLLPCSLGWADTIIDGFYMTHGDFPEVCDSDKFPSLEELRKVHTAEGDAREVGTLRSITDSASQPGNACSMPNIHRGAHCAQDYF